MIILNFIDDGKKLEIESDVDFELDVTSNINKIKKAHLTIFVTNSSEDILELQASKITPFYILNKIKLEKYLNNIEVFKEMLTKLIKEKNIEKEKITIKKEDIAFKPIEVKEVFDIKLENNKIITTKKELDNEKIVQTQEKAPPPPIYVLFKKTADNLKNNLVFSSILYSETDKTQIAIKEKPLSKKNRNY